jgi:uroporphyrinogen decarboxylase
MPEYRAFREGRGFLEMIKNPELATELTMQPVRAFDIDAAIIVSDILPLLEGMGFRLTYEKGDGPVIHNPIATPADVTALRNDDPAETMAYSLAAIRLVKRELAGRIPLIGFSGAPFTLASYAIEGGGSKEYRRTKMLMYREPAAWHALMSHLADQVSGYLNAQIEAGADVVQIFDSWAGALSPFDYAEYVLPYVRQVVAGIRGQGSGVRGQELESDTSSSQFSVPGSGPPIIYFGTGMSGMFSLLRQTEADVIGADWRIPLDDAWAQIGPGFAIQGNLDPMTLFAPWPEIERRAADILDRAAGRPGHIFNLGHGILTETPVENVKRLVDFVHSYSDDKMTR